MSFEKDSAVLESECDFKKLEEPGIAIENEPLKQHGKSVILSILAGI